MTPYSKALAAVQMPSSWDMPLNGRHDYFEKACGYVDLEVYVDMPANPNLMLDVTLWVRQGLQWTLYLVQEQK